jgi:two-component system, chemotaxis family, chemotaxis protein CheY
MNKVIIADDSDTARMFVRRCFEIAGLADSPILEARSGAEALSLLQVETIELVITDLNMPDINGRELIRTMRADDRWADIPIIVVSSAANAELQTELKQLGAQAVLRKPPNPEHASRCLQALTSRKTGL